MEVLLRQIMAQEGPIRESRMAQVRKIPEAVLELTVMNTVPPNQTRVFSENSSVA
jgi:hypothetical protein